MLNRKLLLCVVRRWLIEDKTGMYQELKDSIFLLVPIVTSIALSFILAYLYYKDRNKRKLIFTISIFLSAFGFYSPFMYSIGLKPILSSAEWLFMPLALAFLIAALSGLSRIQNFNRAFILFIAVTAASIIAYIIKYNNPILRLVLESTFVFTAVPILGYIFYKSRATADLNFLIATLCFLFGGLVRNFGTSVDIPVILALFGAVFIGFMFNRPENVNPSTLPSFILLEKKLDEANKNLKVMEEKLLKAERLAAIGELAGLIGHDLRNPLQGIRSATYYIKTHISNEKINNEMLAEIDNCIERSDKIINDLIEYAQTINLEMAPTDPKALTTQALSEVKIPEKIEVINKVTSKPTLILDCHRIEKTFAAIIKNAYDAMPKGGKLKINCKKSFEDIEFSFEDNGEGISEETLDKIWTPLFTTKAKGMGFGLPICKRVIEAHGGKISVESKVGKGTIFRISLPLNEIEK